MMNNTENENPSTTTNQARRRWRAGRRPCAACKYHRMRCKIDCPLAPYFPADKEQQFINVHRLFGEKKVIKILNMVAESDRERAMISIIYEANMRAARPAGGSMSAIGDLQAAVAHCENELQLVKKCIARLQPPMPD